MSARVIDGRTLAEESRKRTAQAARQLNADGVKVRLDAVIVGDPASAVLYTKSQKARCLEVGIDYQVHPLPVEADTERIVEFIHELNQAPEVTGILVNLPLPDHVDAAAVQYAIDPYKDVEGVNPANIGFVFYSCPIIAPCTALAVMEVLKAAACDPRGLDAVVVGQGAIAGRPIALFLAQQAATVTACHVATRDLAAHTRRADLLIAAAGVPGLIREGHVKPGAYVIDVGINRVPGSEGGSRTVGDVEFDEVRRTAGVITPVPGGVGPLTVAVLLRNAVEAASQQHESGRRL